jgi:hypothetical protein
MAAQAAANPERLAALRLHLLEKKVQRAQVEHDMLKAVVHEERDLQRAAKKQSKLQAKLQQLAAAEARLDGHLCYGLPPEWRTGGGGSPGSSGSHGEWNRRWLSGTEVVYCCAQAEQGGQPPRLDITYNEQPVKLQLYRKPFAVGGLRQAFYAR